MSVKLTSINADKLRFILVNGLFYTIAICMSVMAYVWASQFKLAAALVVSCSMIAYDIVLVPRFPMIVHYLNSILATVFSIGFMVLIGFMTVGSTIASKSDPTYATLLERVATKQARIEELEAGKAGCILGDDPNCLVRWAEQNGRLVQKLNDDVDALLLEKQKYNVRNGGKYSDASIAPLAWLAALIGMDVEELNAMMIPLLWVAVLSIQTTLSAAAHGIRIYRPSAMRGLAVLLTMILGTKHRYVENYRAGMELANGGKSTPDQKNQAA